VPDQSLDTIRESRIARISFEWSGDSMATRDAGHAAGIQEIYPPWSPCPPLDGLGRGEANMLTMLFLDSQSTNYDSPNDLRFAHRRCNGCKATARLSNHRDHEGRTKIGCGLVPSVSSVDKICQNRQPRRWIGETEHVAIGNHPATQKAPAQNYPAVGGGRARRSIAFRAPGRRIDSQHIFVTI
jgi:hypothetical protein